MFFTEGAEGGEHLSLTLFHTILCLQEGEEKEKKFYRIFLGGFLCTIQCFCRILVNFYHHWLSRKGLGTMV